MSQSHRAKKRFGQNFLIDAGIIFQIVEAINPQAGDPLIEIGPGLAAMTKPVLARAKEMTVIELDRDLIENLEKMEGLRVINEDVLNVDLPALYPDQKLRIIGNLPYNISTPIIFHLLEDHHDILDMHFMLQKEVIDRLAAEPNSRQYGRLSVMVQRYCDVVPLFEIPPTAFDPAPKVMSQFVRLVPHTEPKYAIADDNRFFEVVKLAFSMKRKMIRNNLKPLMSEAEIEAAGIDPTARAENLTIDDFVTLSNALV
ncbi:16S rRNA (adenine(1518)-N(6)/adenine(1519)-N(6))-dimethyltransferase RsmA [Ignatzschineria sp. RMDPL8A]|uniref:16S rRNA (adenine(1518)-N(6)/adenine(1519)-N(6))- dimethyltransferase RsmA n=1 Tax=Ignatzschineria sp. RMDPL8A TaxID=2999236 RepID=UPI0024466743|nr:16S rRNA (adenine(1518)-N(6)/adenine(1519)-N(6))-dimethyltransferase RsmA [Ignatzschineria sp. RMDPL8A]MDG9729215.1 16S rRNA (adenine(1518)-N(6)/adenine(1519)-N(6))-dimethyltransferase RsmA [Ignatzschineria sp. RMDPL8A]